MKVKSEPVIIKADRKQMPQSLFSMEGEILTCKDNSKVYAEILKCLHPEEVINVKSCDKLEYKAIIFDERAVTN